MITETERKEFKNRLGKVIEKLDNLYESDIMCNILENTVIISIDANQIKYFIQNECSMREWLEQVNNEIYRETRYELDFNPIKNKIYLEMGKEDFADSDDIVGDFIVCAENVLNIVDNSLIV